jgi:glucokinase
MQKQTNRTNIARAIVRVVRDDGPLSRADIARKLQASPAMITRVTGDLLRSNILREQGRSESFRTGAPAILLSFNLDVASILAVDLRLTEAYVALTDLDGNIFAKMSSQLTVDNRSQSVNEFIALLRRVLDSDTGHPPLRAIVLGVPSVIDPQTAAIEWAPSLGWSNLPMREILYEQFQVPVQLENDINLAAVGEHWKGRGRGLNNMVFVSVGTGVGSGIIVNGELYKGSTGAGGEVSYFIVDVDTLRDQVGHIGALETRAAREGIIHRARLAASRYPSSELSRLVGRSTMGLDPSAVFALALQGDPVARIVWNETVDLLAIVIGNLSVVLDPQVIVLGGPSDWYWDDLVQAINSRIGSGLLRPLNLCASSLGRDAVILGAAGTALSLPGVLPL